MKLLERIYRDSRHHQVGQRAHGLLLIYRGIQIEELQKIFQVNYKTIYNWMNNWVVEVANPPSTKNNSNKSKVGPKKIPDN